MLDYRARDRRSLSCALDNPPLTRVKVEGAGNGHAIPARPHGEVAGIVQAFV